MPHKQVIAADGGEDHDEDQHVPSTSRDGVVTSQYAEHVAHAVAGEHVAVVPREVLPQPRRRPRVAVWAPARWEAPAHEHLAEVPQAPHPLLAAPRPARRGPDGLTKLRMFPRLMLIAPQHLAVVREANVGAGWDLVHVPVVHVLVHVVLVVEGLIGVQALILRPSYHLLVLLVLQIHVLGAIERAVGGKAVAIPIRDGVEEIVEHPAGVAGALARARGCGPARGPHRNPDLVGGDRRRRGRQIDQNQPRDQAACPHLAAHNTTGGGGGESTVAFQVQIKILFATGAGGRRAKIARGCTRDVD